MDFQEHVELAKAKREEIKAAADEVNSAADLLNAATAKLEGLYADMGVIETNAADDGYLVTDLRAALDPAEQPRPSSPDAA